MIPVTKPFSPPIEEYNKYLEGIWQRNWLTNNGPLLNELEMELKRYLKVPHVLIVSNGTIALQFAIQALDLKGEIITTPFSYVATTTSIVWEGCQPVFVDIDAHTFNIDPTKIEEAITPETSAILATHVYGNPCDIEAINKIALKHNLKVIYDAAHCFGTYYKKECIYKFGDISTASFHATKLYHMVEGGGVFSQDPELIKRISFMRNFGHEGPEHFNGVGINGKNSEFHAAMGLVNLKYANEIVQKRKAQSLYYDSILGEMPLHKQTIHPNTTYNYAYYPIVLESEEMLLKIKTRLDRSEIFTRRYFYPTLSNLPYLTRQATPIADDISKRILCIPLYFNLSFSEQDLISRLILRTYKY